MQISIRRRFTPNALVLVVLLFAGCADEQRESLHESGHFVADHWPTSLADAATKIDVRLAALRKGEDNDAYGELTDIIGWVPEIAADSDLSEADWIPIHDASRAMSNRLRGKSRSLDNELGSEIERFRELLLKNASTLMEIERSRPGFESEEEPTS